MKLVKENFFFFSPQIKEPPMNELANKAREVLKKS